MPEPFLIIVLRHMPAKENQNDRNGNSRAEFQTRLEKWISKQLNGISDQKHNAENETDYPQAVKPVQADLRFERSLFF
jgi:hypothetical protein